MDSRDPRSADFAARRAAARKELDAIDPAMHGRIDADPSRHAWFGEVYARAGDDPARVPWADLEPHPLTRAFVDGQVRGVAGLKVLDIGCGLGDNAEYFAVAGAVVTAFDFVPDAIDWAKRRFPASRVAYRVADLFASPREWEDAFDLVHECYTLQAIAPRQLPAAFAAFARVLAPQGALILIARARDEDAPGKGPPWPLPPSVFEIAKEHGFAPSMIEDIAATPAIGGRHWRALLRRVGAS